MPIFCRVPVTTSDTVVVERTKKCTKSRNARALFVLGGYYARGDSRIGECNKTLQRPMNYISKGGSWMRSQPTLRFALL